MSPLGKDSAKEKSVEMSDGGEPGRATRVKGQVSRKKNNQMLTVKKSEG